VAHTRAAFGVEALQRGADNHRLVDRAGREVGEGGVARLRRVRRLALHDHAEGELAGGERLDLPHAGTRLGRVQVDARVRPQPRMEQRGDAAGVALARRAGDDQVAPGRDACGIQQFCRAHHRGHAREIVGHAPAIQAPVLDHAGERVVPPAGEVVVRLTIRVGEEDQAATAARTVAARDDAAPLARVDRAGAGELRGHRHVLRTIRHGLDRPAQRVEAARDQALACFFAVAVDGDQRLEIGHVGSAPSGSDLGERVHIMILE